MKESDNYSVISDEANDKEPGDVYGGDREDIDTFFEGVELDEDSDVYEDDTPKIPSAIPAELIRAFNNECIELKSIFIDYDNELNELSQEFDSLYTDYSMDVADGNSTVNTSPVPTQRGLTYSITSDQKVINDFYELLDDYDKLLDKMQKKYNKNGSKHQKMLLQVLKNNITILKSENYLDEIDGFSDYYRTALNGIKGMPGIFFKDSNSKNNTYTTDPKKFDMASENFGLLEQYINTQNFYMTKYLPDKKYRDEDKLISYNPTYNHDYREYLNTQEHFLTKNLAVSSMHPILKDNKKISENKTYADDLSGKKSYTRERLEDIDFELELMDRGWPAVDMPFLREVKRAKEFINKGLKNKDVTDEEKKQLLDLKKIMKEPVDRLFNSYVTSTDVRNSLLRDFEPVLKPYNETFKKLYSRNEETRNKLADVPLVKSYYDTAARNLTIVEMGNNSLLFRKVAGSNEKYLKGMTMEELEKNFDYMLKDLKKVDPKTLRSSDEFSDMKTSLINLVRDVKRLKKEREEVFDDDDAKTYAEIFTELGPKIKATKDLVKRYLDYKKNQFDKDKSRRNSSLKQYREQPRIDMAINLFDKLGYIGDRVNYYADKVNFDKVHGRDDNAKELNTNNLQKNFVNEYTNRIELRSSYRAFLTSRQNVKQQDETKKELKAKSDAARAKNKPKTDAKPNIKL